LKSKGRLFILRSVLNAVFYHVIDSALSWVFKLCREKLRKIQGWKKLPGDLDDRNNCRNGFCLLFLTIYLYHESHKQSSRYLLSTVLSAGLFVFSRRSRLTKTTTSIFYIPSQAILFIMFFKSLFSSNSSFSFPKKLFQITSRILCLTSPALEFFTLLS